MDKKVVVVTGSSGFIGGHLVRHLKKQGCYVHGIDIVPPAYEKPDTFHRVDLRSEMEVKFLFGDIGQIDEVYNLACIMGGMGFIGDPIHEYDIMVGSTRIVTNVLECSRMVKVGKSFYSSSACVYNMHKQTSVSASLKETDVYPAMPDLVYGWQKLFSEQMYNAARMKGLSVRIARFHNIFGPEGTWEGGKEKAPAAICRKIALAREEDEIEIWGSGKQTRSFLYIDECIEGIEQLMNWPGADPLWFLPNKGIFNIGSSEQVTIEDLVRKVALIAGKQIRIRSVSGPVGVMGRSSDNTLIKEILKWEPDQPLTVGLTKTYRWIEEQVKAKHGNDFHRTNDVPAMSNGS